MGVAPKSPVDGGKNTFIYGNDAKAKNSSKCSMALGFPEYGMTNASNFRWEVPRASNPQRVRKGGHLFVGMTPTLKTVSTLSLGFSENGMTKANNFRWGIPPASNPQMVRKGYVF